MANVLKLLRSIVSGNVPNIISGQVAINEADGILFFRNSATNSVEQVKLRDIEKRCDSDAMLFSLATRR